MKITGHIKTLGSFMADLVFPVFCSFCGEEGSYLCAGCLPKLPRLSNQLCIVCKKHAPFGKTHPECVSKNTLDGIISALPYSDPKIKTLIGNFKYQFVFDLAQPLAKTVSNALAGENLSEYFEDFIVIPVPLHTKRFNWRGFNQSALLGKALAAELRIPVAEDLVKRIKFTKPQIELKAEARQANMQNAFWIARPAEGKYLLVDDVVTTGATLNEIAKSLKKSGASEVWAATIAHG